MNHVSQCAWAPPSTMVNNSTWKLIASSMRSSSKNKYKKEKRSKTIMMMNPNSIKKTFKKTTKKKFSANKITKYLNRAPNYSANHSIKLRNIDHLNNPISNNIPISHLNSPISSNLINNLNKMWLRILISLWKQIHRGMLRNLKINHAASWSECE